MMNRILPALAFIMLGFTAFSQCDENNEPKILLIGDSWANLMMTYGTIDDVMEKWGHSNYEFVSSQVVSVNGAETDDFQEQAKQEAIQTLIDDNPSVEVIHVSLGGNDVLGDWHVSFTQAQTDSLRDEVTARLLDVIEFLRSTRPDIRILWSGYTYPNFEEVIEDFSIPTLHPFYGTWDGMGQPTFDVINQILNDFSADFAEYADTVDNVDFITATGLMQYHFGQETPLAVPPGGSYLPFTQPMPAGDYTYPSPMESMGQYGIAIDAFHLSPEGYRVFIDYHTQKFYHKLFMDDLYLLSTGNGKDGAVSDQGDVSDELILGSDGSANFATVLTFNTTQMPDSGIEKASLFLRRETIDGTDPTQGELQIGLTSGALGATINVEADDYTATTDGSGTPCKFGSDGGEGHWIRIQLPNEVLSVIGNSDETQVRIIASGASGSVTFSNSNDVDYAPVLNLDYGITPSGIEYSNKEVALSIYPNPATDMVRIDIKDQQIRSVQFIDTMGKTVKTGNGSIHSVKELPAGVYFVRLQTEQGIIGQRLVVN